MNLKKLGIIDMEPNEKKIIIQHTWVDMLHVFIMYAIMGFALYLLSGWISFVLYGLYLYGFIGFLYLYWPHGKLVFDNNGFRLVKKTRGVETHIVEFPWEKISKVEYYVYGSQSAILITNRDDRCVLHTFNIVRFMPFRKMFYHKHSKWLEKNLTEICDAHKTEFKVRTNAIIKEIIKEYK